MEFLFLRMVTANKGAENLSAIIVNVAQANEVVDQLIDHKVSRRTRIANVNHGATPVVNHNMGLPLVALPLLLLNFLLDVLLKLIYISQISASVVIIHIICDGVQVVCLAVRGSPRLKPLDTLEVLFKLILVAEVVAVVDVVENVADWVMLVGVSVGTRPRVHFFSVVNVPVGKGDLCHRPSIEACRNRHDVELFVVCSLFCLC